MIRDKGPNYQLGFGINSRYDAPFNESEEVGPNPESSHISKALEGHPIMRFFAVSAATMVGMGVAGSLVRKGGKRAISSLAKQAAEDGTNWQSHLMRDTRKTRELFDEWEGVTRTVREGADGEPIESAVTLKGFFFSREEQLHRVRQARGEVFDEGAAAWTWKNELQQSMVRQARRLPYELPGAYLSQRLIVDPLFGVDDQNERKVKWYNPVDVTADFAQQSIKNLAGLLVPFEAGGGMVRHGWRKAMTHGDSASISGLTPLQRTAVDASQALDTTMSLVGADISDFFYKSSKHLNIATRALGAGVHNQIHASKGVVEKLHEARSGFERKTLKQWARNQTAADIFDLKVGPISMPGPFVKGFKQEWFALTEHYAHREAHLAGANTVELSTRARRNLNLPEDVAVEIGLDPHKAYLPGGGSSFIEQVASSLDDLGRSGPASPQFRHGKFYQGQMQVEYKRRLAEALVEDGVDQKDARRFVELSQINRVPSSLKSKGNAWQRIGFGDTETAAATRAEWEEEIGKRTAHLNSGPSITRKLVGAIGRADESLISDLPNVRDKIGRQWEHLYRTEAPKYLSSQLKTGRVPYEDFAGGSIDERAGEYLLKRTASRLGVNPNAPYGAIRQELASMGFSAESGAQKRQMLAFLQTKKDIAAPWSARGFNALGIRPLTVQEGLDRNYFGRAGSKDSDRIRNSIKYLSGAAAEQQGNYHPAFRQQNVGGGVFVSASGKIIDFSPAVEMARRAADSLANNFQIPLIKIKPLPLLGYGVNQSMAESAAIQYVPGMSRHMGLRDGVDDPDAYFWMRKNRARGRVLTMGGGESRSAVQTAYTSGESKPFSTDPFSLAGRHARLAFGDKGQAPSVPRGDGQTVRGALRDALGGRRTFRDSAKSNWKKWFSVDVDQPDSIPRAIGRRKGRADDISNPMVLARKIIDDVDGLKTRYAGEGGAQELLESWDSMEQLLRTYGFSPRVMARMQEAAQSQPQRPISEIFSTTIGDSTIRVADLNRTEDVIDAALRMVGEQFDEGLGSQQQNALRQAEKVLLWRHLNNRTTPGYFNRPAGISQQRGGIHRRVDEFKNDIVKYMAIRRGITGPDDRFDDVISDIMLELDTLHSKKAISRAEYTESRAAVLSTQINFMNIYGFQPGTSKSTRVNGMMEILASDSSGRESLSDLAQAKVGTYGSTVPRLFKEMLRRKHGISADQYAGTEYNPFSGGQEHVFVPTFGTAFSHSPIRALSNALGATTWSDPDFFTSKSLPVAHGFQRLNRYFSTFGAGLDETDFHGPLDLYARGMVGKRALPAVAAATTVLAVDRTLGGMVNDRDEAGNRVYSPLVFGGAARGLVEAQALVSGVVPGGAGWGEKREELLEGDSAIRKGRWWSLGNTPFEGGQIQYYRPSWYRRLKAGGLYTEDTFGSPMERLAFGYDFSPLRPFNPYWFENKHEYSRPYPVSGEYFTGPWGPVTSALNLTAGRILKPQRMQHEEEVQAKLAEYQTVGQSGMYAPSTSGYYAELSGGLNSQINAAGQTNAVIRGINSGVIAPHSTPIAGVPRPIGLMTMGGSASAQPGMPISSNMAGGGYGQSGMSGSGAARMALEGVNESYANAYMTTGSRQSLYGPESGLNYSLLTPGRQIPPRVLPGLDPVAQGTFGYNLSQFGYELQEMFGIYGFAFGSAREALGFGSQDFSPKRPMLTAASRAYGSERGFWDLNLGGLGDVPSVTEGAYGNLELSEIVRRFIPHRRRDINEINPITNNMSITQPWLPGRNYFINFQEGDPYTAIPEGELRLPGVAYDRLHGTHPDMTGRYGLVDKYRILADVAPWSQEFRALNNQIVGLRDEGYISDENYEVVLKAKRQLRNRKRKHNFSQYKYAHQDFNSVSARITREVEPGVYMTDYSDVPVRLAGMRVRSGPEAAASARQLLTVGDQVTLTIDNNRPVNHHSQYLDAVVHRGEVNINRELMNAYGFASLTDDDPESVNAQLFGNDETSYKARTKNPIDILAQEGNASWLRGSIAERISHRNTIFNTKFLPNRTAQEDWERQHVYGATFPQWQNPIQDFLKPMAYKATTRNPVLSAVALGAVGRAFGTSPSAKAAGQFIGGSIGLGSGFVRGSEEVLSGQRFIPRHRRREIAVEEYVDVLTFVKYQKLFNEAIAAGDLEAASEFRDEMQRTMYGADVYEGMPWQYASAVPKRKRDHFKEMIKAPVNERDRILSTAGRLERRLFQAAWGMPIEERPDLASYFSRHELPGQDWEGWQPNVNMDHVKIKLIQSAGLDASQMGYYPQQLEQANLVNVSYPDFERGTSSRNAAAQLQNVLYQSGVAGNVREIRTPYPGNRIQMNAGVY